MGLLSSWISYMDRIWGGDATVSYDSPSASYPIHKITVKNVLLGAYLQFDMALKPERV